MDKPAFHLPSMADVDAARGTTGLKVVSTFSGCGGSCLGFEMAGYEVLWASEFVEAARETYAANHPHTKLDGRDIRKVTPQEILDAIGMKVGELDVLNGSPPCASFSTAGKREEGWGAVKKYSDTEQRSDDLFFEFARLVKGLQPRAFVAENVAGLTMGSAIGYFKEIMRALDACGYDVRCKVLDAQWLGVPQSRRRAIFVGVRKDLKTPGDFPKPLPYNYALKDVLPSVREIGFSSGFNKGSVFSGEEPAPTIMAGGIAGSSTSQHFVTRVPVRADESIEGTAIGLEWKKLRQGEVSRKYQSLIRGDENRPSFTITAAAGARHAAGPTHPTEPRKFSIEELRIICGFPADFALKGTFAQQWERLGRAVPPPMMREVAAVLRDGFFTKLGRTRKGFKEAR